MKKPLKNIISLLLVILSTVIRAQNDSLNQPSSKQHTLELNLTQNTASLFSPSLSPIHPGINITGSFQWNKNNNLQLKQDGILGFFHHSHFQNVMQLYGISSQNQCERISSM